MDMSTISILETCEAMLAEEALLIQFLC